MRYGRRGLLRGPTDFAGRGGHAIFASAPAAPSDPDFANVVLLLDFLADDGAQGIIDLSNSAHPALFVGEAEVDTAQQFLGENMVLCGNGVGDFITFPNHNDWDFGTGDFTMEVGIRLNTDVNTNGFLSAYDGAQDTGVWLRYDNSAGKIIDFGWGTTLLKAESFALAANTTYHLAVCRSGTNLRLFIDGVQLGTPTTDSTDMSGGNDAFLVGALSPSAQSVNGWVGAVRITKGVARYTANFTPPTEFYPYPTITDSDFANVALLLDMAGADASTTFIDLSDSTHPIAVNAQAQIDTALKKFGTGSLLVDGTDDNIQCVLDTAAKVTAFDLGSANFTIEFHMRANTSLGADQVFEMGLSGNYHIALLMSNNSMFMEYSTDGTSYVQTDSALDATDATWQHFALVRNGNDLNLYMEGVKGAGTADVTGLTLHALDTAAIFYIGGADDSGAGFDGNIDNFRYTKGVARYTENFTPPVREYPIAA